MSLSIFTESMGRIWNGKEANLYPVHGMILVKIANPAPASGHARAGLPRSRRMPAERSSRRTSVR